MAPPSDHSSRHLRKLAALVTQRRVALDIRDKRVAAARCGLSVTTYSKVEAGQTVTGTSYGKIEVGFGMRAGSCAAVLQGADSITLEDGTELIEGGQIRDFVDPERFAEASPGALTKSAGLYAPELTLGQIENIHRGFMEELRRKGVLPAEG
ncbi:hypothetical protein [Streptomyces aureocirculatus]|uniref:hypothetical protein n=1 Tax=Streptomyces aureocirculatus TaxID=67275 RepID=UPI0004C66F70|nr:hypothetical protein [Streptomyces aureocirculatus]